MGAAVKIEKFQIDFYNKKNCDRCKCSLEGKGRIMSWFNDDTLCIDNCHEAENWIKEKIRERGENPNAYEGCGEVPEVWNDKKICRSGPRIGHTRSGEERGAKIIPFKKIDRD